MSASEKDVISIHDQGTTPNDKKKKMECKFCGELLSSFYNLKCHMGHEGENVTHCLKVPSGVVQLFRGTSSNSAEISSNVVQFFGRTSSEKTENVEKEVDQEINQTSSVTGRNLEVHSFVDHDHTLHPKRQLSSQTVITTEEVNNALPSEAQNSITSFFYETGVDFSLANSPSFQRMINASIGQGQLEYKIPSSQELKGCPKIEVKQMSEYINTIRTSWANTGCSILFDGWTDKKGRNLVIFLVDCPQGPVYLKAADVSPMVGDVDALQALLDGVIHEVGITNVVQVVTFSTAGWVEALGKQFMDRQKTIFWTVSASHCIELMLEKIGMMDSVVGVLNKAKEITKLIHGHVIALRLLNKKHTLCCDLIKPCRIRSAMPFMTLENIVSKYKELKLIFSSDRNKSPWATRNEGKRVAVLFRDLSFWNRARMVLKAVMPLVHVLCLIYKADKPQMGYIYETMGKAKETIKEEFLSKESQYMPFWNIIDDIGNTCFHSPLHAAAYYLNPCFFYSSEFHSDPEVDAGLWCCIRRMVKDKHTQDLISAQLEDYVQGKGAFSAGASIDQRTSIHPALWWYSFGGHCPQLQRFAVFILSQTTDGAARYGVEKSLAEKLLSDGQSTCQQEELNDVAFVNYNLYLQQCCPEDVFKCIADEEVNPIDDWITDGLE